MKKCTFRSVAFLVVVLCWEWNAFAQTTFLCGKDPARPLHCSLYGPDTMFLGLGLTALSADSVIKAAWKSNPRGMSTPEGEFYFMEPDFPDSARFLFNNPPSDSPAIVLGSYPVGTRLYFMYVVTDTHTTTVSSTIRNKRQYSGENLVGSDLYISEATNFKGLVWAAAGRLNDSVCTMGFGGTDAGAWDDLLFNVSNVYRAKLEKYKLDAPRAEPPASRYPQGTRVALFSRSACSPTIYYTLDGSDPLTYGQIYTDSIALQQSCTLRAVARMPGDSLWIDSDVSSLGYTVDVTHALTPRAMRAEDAAKQNHFIYSPKGVLLFNASQRTLPNGVYFVVERAADSKSLAQRVMVAR